MPPENHGMRLAKYLCMHNVCSRREAERLIANGQVCVNSEKVITPVFFVKDTDVITVQGKRVAQIQPKLWLYNKPRGQITTHHDPQNRLTVFQAVRDKIGRVISVGRLDFNSEGLLLLTNSSPLAHSLECSSQKRIYKVRVYGCFVREKWKKYETDRDDRIFYFDQLIIQGIRYHNIRIAWDRSAENYIHRPGNFHGTVTLIEGKNLEIRRIMKFFGLQVNRLQRTHYGPFELGKIPLGHIQTAHLTNFQIRLALS